MVDYHHGIPQFSSCMNKKLIDSRKPYIFFFGKIAKLLHKGALILCDPFLAKINPKAIGKGQRSPQSQQIKKDLRLPSRNHSFCTFLTNCLVRDRSLLSHFPSQDIIFFLLPLLARGG